MAHSSAAQTTCGYLHPVGDAPRWAAQAGMEKLEMLIVLIVVTVSGSLVVEWLLDHVRRNYEIEWSHGPWSTDPET